jgi:hypothetical protein
MIFEIGKYFVAILTVLLATMSAVQLPLSYSGKAADWRSWTTGLTVTLIVMGIYLFIGNFAAFIASQGSNHSYYRMLHSWVFESGFWRFALALLLPFAISLCLYFFRRHWIGRFGSVNKEFLAILLIVLLPSLALFEFAFRAAGI